jgi:hypothetical protein
MMTYDPIASGDMSLTFRIAIPGTGAQKSGVSNYDYEQLNVILTKIFEVRHSRDELLRNGPIPNTIRTCGGS